MNDIAIALIALLAGLLGGAAGTALLRRKPAPPPERVEDKRLAELAEVLNRSNHDIRGALSPALLMVEQLEGHTDAAVRQTATSISRAMDHATRICREAAAAARRIYGGE